MSIAMRMCDNPVTDTQLCVLSNAGDKASADILTRRYGRLVRSIARLYYLTGGDSEDLVQEGMLGFLSAVKDYTPEKGEFEAFAATCVRRKIISAVRHDSTNKQKPLNLSISIDELSENQSELVNSPSNPEELYIDREERENLVSALSNCLSGTERSILSLYLQGLSYSEMAAQLSCSTKSIENAVYRIRRKVTKLNRIL